MTRVLVITNMYPPHHYGGYELACQDVVEGLRQRGHDVWVLTTTHRRPDVRADAESIDGVARTLSFYWDDFVLTNPSLRRSLAIERGNQAALEDAMAIARPDVVSAWNMGAMSVGLLSAVIRKGVPLVLVVADTWVGWAADYDAWLRRFRRRGRFGRLVGRVAERLLRVPSVLPDLGRSATVLYSSEWLRARAANEAPWVFDRSAIVPWGIDVGDFSVAAAPADRRWEWRLLFVGRIDERKGVDVAVRALAALPDAARLRIVGPDGDPDHRERLEALIAVLGVGDRVSFASTDRAGMAQEYSAADVFLFPSVWAEPFGLVGIEAMACGTPVVATGTGGSGEFLIHEQNCLRVAPGEAAELASAVDRLARDVALRARLRTNGLKTAATFTVDNMVEDLERWHTAAASRFSGGEPAPRALDLDGRT